MNSWYSLELGDGVEAYEQTEKIQESFIPLYSAAGCPKDMALFSHSDLSENIVTVYFSPSAHAIAKLFNAVACEKPSKDRLGLLAGDQRCIELLFPG